MSKMFMSNNQVQAISRNRNEQKNLIERIEQLDQTAFQSKGAIKQDMRSWRQFRIQNIRNSGWSSKSLRPEPGEDVFQTQLRSNRSNSPTQGKDTYSKPWAYTYSHESHNKVYRELAQVGQTSKKALDLTYQAAQSTENQGEGTGGGEESPNKKPLSKFKSLSKTVSLLAPRQKLLGGRQNQVKNFFDLTLTHNENNNDNDLGNSKAKIGFSTIQKINKFSSACKTGKTNRLVRSYSMTPSDTLTKSIHAIKGLAKSKRLFKCVMCGKHADANNLVKSGNVQNVALAYRGLQRAQAILKSNRKKMNNVNGSSLSSSIASKKMCLCCQMMYERKAQSVRQTEQDYHPNDLISKDSSRKNRRSLSSVVDLTDEQKSRIQEAKDKVSKVFQGNGNNDSFDDLKNRQLLDDRKEQNNINSSREENELNEIAKTANAVVEDDYECDNESHQRVMKLLQEEVIDKLNKITSSRKKAAAARKFSTVSRASSLFRSSQTKKKKTFQASGIDVFTRIAKFMLLRVLERKREREKERLRLIESQANNNLQKFPIASAENHPDQQANTFDRHLARRLSYVNPDVDLNEWNSRRRFKEGGWLVSRKASVIACAKSFRKDERRESNNSTVNDSRRDSNQTYFDSNNNGKGSIGEIDSSNKTNSDENKTVITVKNKPFSLSSFKSSENKNEVGVGNISCQLKSNSRQSENIDINNNNSMINTSNTDEMTNHSPPLLSPIPDNKNRHRKPPWISGSDNDNHPFPSRLVAYHRGVRISNYVHPERRHLTSARPGMNSRKELSIRWHSSAGATVVQHQFGEEPGIGDKTFTKQARHRALQDMIEANHTPEPDETQKLQQQDLETRVNKFLQSLSTLTITQKGHAMAK